ncbi:CD81 antigen-like [Sinocyclocheilus grahami]|uniref:CD81 antigen-like n=1 Tax=Sinocyclocheilus grahami TaxID=75366 RepID=UPI0007ACB78E|nr:PREDICTED: CD81 antigen-like [Sinocyclocheilus grahami]
MGVEGCTKCIKYLLFFFNFIFWLAGCVILGVSLWLRHDNKTSSLLELKYENTEAPSTFYIIHVHFLSLPQFFACLVILFACEVAAGIWGFMNKDKISKELITFYDSVYDRGIFLTDSEQKQAAAAVLKIFHETVSSPDVLRSTQLIKLTQTPLKPNNSPDAQGNQNTLRRQRSRTDAFGACALPSEPSFH